MGDLARRSLVIATFCALFLSEPTAFAQSFRLPSQQSANGTRDGALMSHARVERHGDIALRTNLGLSFAPYHVSLSGHDVELIDQDYRQDITLAFGLFDHLSIHIQAPFLLGQRGSLSSSAGIGDISAGLQGALFPWDSSIQFALRAALVMPTAGDNSMRGFGKIAGDFVLAADIHISKAIRFHINLGLLAMSKVNIPSHPAGIAIGSQARAGLSIDWVAMLHDDGDERLRFRLEALTNTPTSYFLERDITGIEGALEMRYDFDGGAFISLMGGVGRPNIPGTPSVGAQLGFGYRISVLSDNTDDEALNDDSENQKQDDVPEPKLAENTTQRVDPKPTPPPVVVDSDGDGLLDDVDRCPHEAEDKDGFEDDDGCLDADNDKDGIEDRSDKCVDEAEDNDGFEDDDGCPDVDNDNDGFVDDVDPCPNAPSSERGGCPAPDADDDGLEDALDSCPNEPGNEANHGCANPTQTFRMADTLQHGNVVFKANRARLLTPGKKALADVAAWVISHSNVSLRVVVSYRAETMAKSRAKRVRQYLLEKGVREAQLTVESAVGDENVVTFIREK